MNTLIDLDYVGGFGEEEIFFPSQATSFEEKGAKTTC